MNQWDRINTKKRKDNSLARSQTIDSNDIIQEIIYRNNCLIVYTIFWD